MKKTDDPNSTTMTVRLSAEAKEKWKRLAERDNRTVGKYLEQLLDRIEKRDSFDLADVMDQLEVIKTMMKAKAKTATPRKEKWEKLYNMPLDAEDGEQLMSRESWIAWIDHLKKMLVHPINEYSLSQNLRMFEKHYDEGYNIDYVISDLIMRSAKSVFISTDVRKEFNEENKRKRP